MSEHCLLWINAEGSLKKGQGTRWQQMPHLIPQGQFSVGGGRGGVVAAFCHTKTLRTQKRQRSCTLKDRVLERRKTTHSAAMGQRICSEICTKAPRTPQLNTGAWGNYQRLWKEPQKWNGAIRETSRGWGSHLLLRQTSARVTMNGLNIKADLV